MKFTTLKPAGAAAAFAAAFALPVMAQADTRPDYTQQSTGTSGCDVSFGPELGGFDLPTLKEQATLQGAYGFTYDASNGLSKLITAPFPRDCKAAADANTLYLATGPVYYYEQMPYGFDGCDVTFGDLWEDTTADAMYNQSRLAGAVGFTFHPDLHYGKVIVGAYPQGCKSDPSMSWPLYLAEGATANYVEQDFGPGECDLDYGPVINGTNQTAMNVATEEAGAHGYLFQETISRGKLILEPLPEGCTANDRYLSWPLFLKE